MKRTRRFEVGGITIQKDGNKLIFDGTFRAEEPGNVIIAMLAVSRYLKWHNGPEKKFVLMYEDRTAKEEKYGACWEEVWIGDVSVDEAIWQDGKKPKIAKATISKSGRTVYVSHKEVMHICWTGNTNWVEISRNQLVGAINDWYYNKNTILIPSYAFRVLPMMTVEKKEAFVQFEEADFLEADKKFIEFIENNCKEAGEYSFPNDEFRKATNLPTAGLVWHYLTNRHEGTTFNGGLWICSANQEKDTIRFRLG